MGHPCFYHWTVFLHGIAFIAIISTEASIPVLLPPEPTQKLKMSPEHYNTTRSLTPEADVGLLSRWDSQHALLNVKDRRHISVTSEREPTVPSQPLTQINKAADSGSATEPEDDLQSSNPGPGPDAGQQLDIRMRSPTPSRGVRGNRSRGVTKLPSDTDSSPVRPIKKSKPCVVSSDEDSEEERKKRAAQIRNGTSGPGLRQPIKRGGKRF